MVAGVGSIDLALLVVAADDGWMPQTEEHLQILTYLGVTRGVVALTKIDLADRRAGRDRASRLLGLRPSNAAIVPTSTSSRPADSTSLSLHSRRSCRTRRRRSGTSASRGCRWTGRLRSRASARSSPARWPADVLRRDRQSCSSRPARPTRVRNVQTHRRGRRGGSAGVAVALNLPDLSVDAGNSRRPRRRSGAATSSRSRNWGSRRDTIDVLLERSPRRLGGTRSGAARAEGRGGRAVHQGSGDFPAEVYFIGEGKELTPGGRCSRSSGSRARLRLRRRPASPARLAGQHTLAGGVVLDPDASGGVPAGGSAYVASSGGGRVAGDGHAIRADGIGGPGRAERSTSVAVQSRFSAQDAAGAVAAHWTGRRGRGRRQRRRHARRLEGPRRQSRRGDRRGPPVAARQTGGQAD